MPIGRTVFAQFLDLIPRRAFERCVARYRGAHRVHSFSCYDQPLCLAFAQLTYREGLRDIETCLRALQPKLHHAGLRGRVARSALADANETRDWRIYGDFAQLDALVIEPGAFYVFDRGYTDFGRLYAITEALAFFVFRGKRGLAYVRRLPRPVDKTSGLRSDQTIVLCGPKTATVYPVPLRRITYVDLDTQQRFVFRANKFALPALQVAQPYKCRWQVELFFKWIKQHLRIKAIYGTSMNAVKTQVWSAISVYVLVAILKKELQLPRSLYELLQILSLTLFERVPLSQVVTAFPEQDLLDDSCNQLSLSDL
jgi:hypothetical protein